MSAALAALLLLAGCGTNINARQAVSALRSGLPISLRAHPLNSALVTSTPDGGFYTDPTYLHFYYLRTVPLSDVSPLLTGSEAQDLKSLSGLGPLLEVVITATNPGASTSAVDLIQTVLESRVTARLDPAGVHSTLQRTYYEPIRPIVVISSNRLDVCSADVNPGAKVWMLAVYPPVNLAVKIAVVDSGFVAPKVHGFYLPVGRGDVPGQLPTTLYAQDVDHCIQILNQS
ncbi:MAG TPA: hypothetical protein VNH20_01620 [Candidatus Dormibacteraeota bacterium]|nr:hypothetical protein [Candidatus Dormibacteraeota bacterium]